jgi:hypothetical protein
MLSAGYYDAELAERYCWINRALPAATLNDFVEALAHRIAGFPAAGHATVKDWVNAVALPSVEAVCRDSELFVEGLRSHEAQSRLQDALKRRFQTRDKELNLPELLSKVR